jgi:hypothetical protein
LIATPNNLKEDYALAKSNECFDEIDENLTAFSALSLDQLKALLDRFTEKSIYRKNTRVWMICYQVARHLDPKTFEEICDSYQEADRDCLPTKSLTVLKKAHEILGELKCCMKDEVSNYNK